MMKRMLALAVTGSIAWLAVSAVCLGQAPGIIGFEHDGTLTFNSSGQGGTFTLEFTGDLGSGQWTNWSAVTDQPITGAVMSVPTPVYFRIKQKTEPTAGMIRWNGADAQVFTGRSWVSLTGGAPEVPGMVLVPGGTFTMGSDVGGSAVDHEVTLSSFYLMKYEVTYNLWHDVRTWATNNGYAFQNAGREGRDGTVGAAPTAASNEPVTTISWRDAMVWCNARSEKDGLTPVYTYNGNTNRNSANVTASDNAVLNVAANGYRLPTEAEWEYAARFRDGTSWTPGDYASGASDGINNLEACAVVAWYGFNSGSDTHDVGGKIPNLLGIYDMSGNVYEWCWDWYAGFTGDAQINPTGPTGPLAWRTMRGGSWWSGQAGLRCATREAVPEPSYTWDDAGFRCARGL